MTRKVRTAISDAVVFDNTWGGTVEEACDRVSKATVQALEGMDDCTILSLTITPIRITNRVFMMVNAVGEQMV